MPSGDSLSAPPEDLRPRTKHTRFGGVDVRPYRFTAPGYSEPRTSGHYWCSPLSSYVMSSITQFVPTRLVVGDIAEATLVAIATAPDKRAALDLLQELCRLHIDFVLRSDKGSKVELWSDSTVLLTCSG